MSLFVTPSLVYNVIVSNKYELARDGHKSPTASDLMTSCTKLRRNSTRAIEFSLKVTYANER